MTFDLFIGIDYSGAESPTSRLKSLQMYAARAGEAPQKQLSPARSNDGQRCKGLRTTTRPMSISFATVSATLRSCVSKPTPTESIRPPLRRFRRPETGRKLRNRSRVRRVGAELPVALRVALVDEARYRSVPCPVL